MKPHVLAARLDSAGDVLLMGPAVRALAHGSSRVTMLCGPRGYEAAKLLPGPSDVLVHEAAWIDAEPGPFDTESTLSLVKELVSLDIDEAVIFTSFHQSALPLALLLRMAGIKRISAISDDYPGSLLDVRHRVSDNIHEVQRALSLANAAGFRLPDGDEGLLEIKESESEFDLGVIPPYVVVHPGASVPARAWSPERHAALVQSLAAQGINVAVTGGPSEKDLTRLVSGQAPWDPGDAENRPVSHPAAQSFSRVWNLGGMLSFEDFGRLLADAEAVVVANTGPAHLAAAVGTPVVSLFAPTLPAVRWRPWKVPQILLGDQEIGCAGCRAKQCPVPGHPCLETVNEESVQAALYVLLAGVS